MGGTDEEAMRLEVQAAALSDVIEKEIEAMDIQSGMSILDAGCGTGAITRRLAQKAHPAKVTGVDFDRVFIENAKAIVDDENIDNIEYALGDIDNLTYPDDSFDLAFCRLVLMHVEDPVKTVSEFKRVTKKGGAVAISDVDDDTIILHPYLPKMMDLWRRYGQWAKTMKMDRHIGRQLFSILSQAGLEKIKIIPISIYRTQETPEQLRMFASIPVQLIDGKKKEMMDDGIFTETENKIAMEEFETFVSHPGAFLMSTSFLAIGYVP
jgi:ubiquinone/menaquinone biosynthesis C-methylase UbiE